jgi:peptidyl-prolyl cis-trans isomerase B (cyclophilin B)
MSKRKTRERQLARYQAKREAERRHKRRQRITAAVVALAVGLGGTIFAVVAFTGGDDAQDPNATPTPSATATPSATPSESPSATPTPRAPAVACGSRAPEVARGIDRTYGRIPALRLNLAMRYFADVETSCGTISLELFAQEAPYSVNSFVFLAERDYFDGLVFNRIENTIDIIQGGNPQCTTLPCDVERQDGPGYTLPDETFNGLEFEVGSLAMANAGPDTAGSQFFVITGDLGLQLPAQYTVFGKVVEGLDVARRIQDIPVGLNPANGSDDLPRRRVYIEDVTIRTELG